MAYTTASNGGIQKVVLAVVVPLVAALVSVFVAWGAMGAETKYAALERAKNAGVNIEQDKSINEHEKKIAVLESQLRAIGTDISAIKDDLKTLVKRGRR